MKLKTEGVAAWSNREQLPNGTYIVKVVEAKENMSKAGNPQIILDLQVADGDFAGAELRDWITITESSMGRVVQALQGLGVDTSADVELDVGELVGRRAEVVVREETYVGTNRETGESEPRTASKVKAYRRVAAERESDIPTPTGFDHAPVNGAPADDKKLPF